MGSADVLPTTCSRSARNCTHVKHRLGICRGSGQAQAWLGPLGLETELRPLCSMMPQSVNAELVDCGVPRRRETETRSYFDFVGPSTHVGRVSAGLSSPTLTTPDALPPCVCVCIHSQSCNCARQGATTVCRTFPSRKMVQMNLFAGRNRDADVENGHADTEQEEEGWTDWETRTDINTPPCLQQILVGGSAQCSVVT